VVYKERIFDHSSIANAFPPEPLLLPDIVHWKLVVGAVLAALVIAGGVALLLSFREHSAMLEFKHGLQKLQQTVNGFAIAEPGESMTKELAIPGAVRKVTFGGRAIGVTYENGSMESYGVDIDLGGPELAPGKYVLRLTKTGIDNVTIEILG